MQRQDDSLPGNPARILCTRTALKRFVLLGVCLSLAIFLCSCKKQTESSLAPAQIHRITHDLAAAATAAVPAGTSVKLKQGSSDRRPAAADTILIVLKMDASTATGRASLANLARSLNAVATQNHLTQDAPIQSGDLLRFTLRHSGVTTHEIEIVSRAASFSARETKNSDGASQQPRLAVILDDLGSDRTAAAAIFTLPYPLTVSVLPDHEHSAEIAREAHQRGYQVMLHLPMQSVANETPESQELHPGMPEPEVAALVGQFLQNVPDVVGVNNHQGSQATADAPLMDELMPVLRERNLFYIDSRTTAATVAYDAAQENGVRSAFRNVPFLDDVAEVPAVRKQLELALRGAREKGEAIAIGHPHPATLQALHEILPQAGARGVRLVFASELVH